MSKTFSKATNIFRKSTPSPSSSKKNENSKEQSSPPQVSRKAIVHPSNRGSVPVKVDQNARKKIESFPIKLKSQPDQIPVVVRYTSESTVSEFLMEHKDKISEITPISIDNLQVLTEDNQVLAATQILSEHQYIISCRVREAMPGIILREKTEKKRFLSQNPSKEGNSLALSKTLKKINEVDIQFIFPNGKTRLMSCKIEQSVALIKDQLKSKELTQLTKPMHTYILRSPEGFINDETLIIGALSYIESCRKEGITPSLIIVEKSAAISKKEKKINLEIGSLIGSPIVWTQDDYDTEITQFRKSMQWVRFQEKKLNGTPKQIKTPESSIDNSRDPLDNLPTSPSKTLVKVRLPLLDVSKTIVLNENETVEQFKVRIFEKYYLKKTSKPPSSYVLKVSGLADYLSDESMLFINVDYVKSCLASQKKIELILVEDEVTDDPEQLAVEDFPNEEFLEDPTIQYDHEQLTCSNLQWDQMSRFSIWDLIRSFRIKIIGAENVGPELQNSFLFVSVGLFHSGKQLSPFKYTNVIPYSPSPRWYQWIETTIEMKNIPREARVCFTFYSCPKRDDLSVKEPLGCVNLLLFDYKLQLRTGLISLNLWPGEVNPIGTCIANNKPKHFPAPPTLFIELDTYEAPVVFPTEPWKDLPVETQGKKSTSKASKVIGIESELSNLFKKDALYKLSPQDKSLLWSERTSCFDKPGALPKLLQSTAYNDRMAVQIMHQFLSKWSLIPPVEALELLDSNFADTLIRQYAVRCLEALSDEELLDYLLQLTQVLKYESYHDSALARFLIKRSLRNRTIGHFFFWYLKSEVEVPEISERYSLLLEAYLRGCGTHRVELNKQTTLLRDLVKVSNAIKPLKDTERKDVMLKELAKIQFPGNKVQLPLNSSLEVKGFKFDKCKYMDSKKLPLWLAFENHDENVPPKYVIFKTGDDLRQDMLTLQMFRLMEKYWKNEGLDLRLSPYGCLATGNEEGMIEVVLNAETLAKITKNVTAAFKDDPLMNWLKQNNPTEDTLELAITNFMYSCAGYCVATYVLGIGDRHNDNIMLTRDGKMFHIDFGHFLGNYKTKYGFKRERAPFIFTPDFAFIMGGRGSAKFNDFVKICCNAYNIVRKHSNVFINLFELMLSTGIPELQSADDIEFLRDHLMLDSTDEQAKERFTGLIYESLTTKTTQVTNAIHILLHNK